MGPRDLAHIVNASGHISTFASLTTSLRRGRSRAGQTHSQPRKPDDLFARLPPEVKHKIFGESYFFISLTVSPRDLEEDQNNIRWELEDGTLIALVCRDWRKYGQKILLRSLRLEIYYLGQTYLAHKLTRARNTILENPALGQHVESLRFSAVPLGSRSTKTHRFKWEVKQLTKLLRLLPGLKSLTALGYCMDHLLLMLPAIKSQCLQELTVHLGCCPIDAAVVCPANWQQFWKEVARHSSLCELRYAGKCCQVDTASPGSLALSIPPASGIHNFRLQLLDLRMHIFCGEALLEALDTSILRELELVVNADNVAWQIIPIESVRRLHLSLRRHHDRHTKRPKFWLVNLNLASYPSLTDLRLTTHPFEGSNPYFAPINVEALLGALPVTLRSLHIDIPTCNYDQNKDVIKGFWLRKQCPDLNDWEGYQNEYMMIRLDIFLNYILSTELGTGTSQETQDPAGKAPCWLIHCKSAPSS